MKKPMNRLINSLKLLRYREKNDILSKVLYQYYDAKYNIEAKKYIKRKKLHKKHKIKQELRSLTTKELFKIHKFMKYNKELIYLEVRKDKIKKNKIIPLNAYEIEIKKKNSSLLSKIPFIGEGQKETDYYSLYFGYGGIAKLLEVKQNTNSTFILNDKELYNFQKDDENKKERQYFLEGKKLIFINNKVIFNAEFDENDNKFIYDITPDYYYSVIDNVIDYRLTMPTIDTDAGGLIKKYWKWVVAGIAAYFLYQYTQGQNQSPLFIPFIGGLFRWKAFYHSTNLKTK